MRRFSRTWYIPFQAMTSAPTVTREIHVCICCLRSHISYNLLLTATCVTAWASWSVRYPFFDDAAVRDDRY